MRKLFLLFLISITLFLTACDYPDASSLPQNNGTEEVISPLYLEVVFGNGEALRTEIEYIAFPQDLGGDICEGFEYHYYDAKNFSCITYLHPSLSPSIRLPKSIHVSYAKLLTGEKYSFSEAYNVSFDEENTTVTVYVWRDEPYETERRIFGGNAE